jgi:hypothetical protein
MKLVKVNKNKADHINMYIIPCVATTCAHSLNNRVLKVLLSQAKKPQYIRPCGPRFPIESQSLYHSLALFGRKSRIRLL